MKQVLLNQAPNFFGDSYIPPKAICTQGLLEEVNLHACSPQAVNMYGGAHTTEALRQLMIAYAAPIYRAKDHELQPIVDVRIHRLFPGQFPAIPGWHCDFVPRGGYSGQPNFGLCSQYAFHVCLILSDQEAGVSNTEYVMDPLRLVLEDQEHVYREVHRGVEHFKPIVARAPDGRFTWFNQKTIHRASPAHRRGVRLFMRFSMIEKPMILNKANPMPHVYQLAEENGW